MLTVEHLQKTYNAGGRPLEVLRDVSFTVEEGEFVTVVGPSGAGKTTLLRCMAGLLPPTGGSVSLTSTGRVIDSPPPEIACVFQDYSRSLMAWYKVGRNVELPLRNTIRDRAERQRVVKEALHSVGLDGFADSYPWQLSGGMQQRVAIARALAYRPEFLIMDEPFASVDAQTRADLEDLILRVRQEVGVTVVLVTHDIDEAVYLGDRVVVVSSRPTVVMDVIDVDLPRPRSQVETKALPRFAELRTQVARLITQATAEAASHV
ncbi:ABC transporter ATP-binding protein [Microbacterium immunditiarum]|uniref:NitT/TauT family transport system ATP-binding protein n=1 Tax=Microbacterium immunditiarum TaxID=337480 RepID=A0A7Y9KI16_9MICO|nr:ABC transporter ATP-binding protein [Microbacterium immunditiarum]NYE18280.1 NitT/TauT family transport system ATP-binding protein [Microbacterium immunditiarum]